MFPEEFIQRLSSQPWVSADTLLKALQTPSPVSIRINPLKLMKEPLNSEAVPWCSNGYYLSYRPTYTLDPYFHAGCYYPQEASGMFLEQVFAEVAEPDKRLNVLDLCGSPGGKSTHISSLIGPSGLLISNEVIRSRASILNETMTKWGHGNVLVTQNDPVVFGKLTGYFDIILIDAPCSGEGMFRNKAAISEWSVENANLCSVRQKRILMDVWASLRENGILIYSTCTFNPDENEENIKWLLSHKKAECLRIDVSAFPGITEIDHGGIFGYGFYPDRIKGEGLFIAVVRKRSAEVIKRIRIPKIGDLKPSKADIEIATSWSDFPTERIIKNGEELIAIPSGHEDYLYLFQNLKVVKSGSRLATKKKNDYVPSHELALSCNLKRNAFPVKELELTQSISYLRRDNLKCSLKSKGWNIVSYKGVNLGFVNNLGNRLNNYFPVEWRIRLETAGLIKILPVAWR